ncbi:ATP-binding protein [Siccirubricoccus deserti]|uniref:GTP-binding protein n=1 Tax=Siccirubricoccus deserti TaxID=2013562 RepID=A0A9X0R2X6_9PROT|nr:GTP-binding protein [Siccirubricoccus deserti]MBC4018601.1 GTP-binding protein [Siccirubricoccus deserti]GGC67165.1 ATP-binding protein [Siccirubricoccus deserti]
MPAASIPVTVLTGFLGAGKTTLLNQLLRCPELRDTAVLINEFGEEGLDHLLVERLDEDTVLLNAGCLCCTVRGDILRALDGLAARAAAGRPIRRVVIETTGLADPAPILQTLMAEPRLLRSFRLDCVLTMVDAVNGDATLDAQPEAVKQAAVADRLVLTKADLVAAPAVAALEARLRALNPGAPLHRAVLGGIGPDILLSAGPYDPAAKAPEVAAWPDAEAWATAQAHHLGHHHHHDINRHDARIQSFCLSFDEPLPLEGLASWLEMLVATRGDALLRVKGLLNLAGEDQPVVLHAVQHVFHLPARLAAWPAGHDRRSRLVFILRDLPRQVVEDGLAAFIAAARGAPVAI